MANQGVRLITMLTCRKPQLCIRSLNCMNQVQHRPITSLNVQFNRLLKSTMPRKQSYSHLQLACYQIPKQLAPVSNPAIFYSTSSEDNGLDQNQIKKRIESLTDQFMEARELMTDAQEVKGTVYYSEDLAEAQQAVEETLTQYRSLMEQLNEAQRLEVQRSIGLKMEELRAQLAMIQEENAS